LLSYNQPGIPKGEHRAPPVFPAARERARQASCSVAYAITHLERPRFVVAYAAAIVALNPDGALEAGNAASAIATSGCMARRH
jgi:hypothetical protein